MSLDAHLIWHKDFKDSGYDVVLLPGGFSYGDHLRAGVIAAYSPAMKIVKDMAEEGKPILGICNGFQILVESGLLPGALLQNACLTFVCKWVILKTMTSRTPFTKGVEKGAILRVPIAHNEGRYFNEGESLKDMYENDQIVFKYVDEAGKTTEDANPNGALENIAGVCNLEGNVVGMMPHPERSSEAILSPYETEDGRLIFESMIRHLE